MRHVAWYGIIDFSSSHIYLSPFVNICVCDIYHHCEIFAICLVLYSLIASSNRTTMQSAAFLHHKQRRIKILPKLTLKLLCEYSNINGFGNTINTEGKTVTDRNDWKIDGNFFNSEKVLATPLKPLF